MNCALLKRYDGSMYKASWHAAQTIQRAIRGTLGRWILQRALVTVYLRTYDDQTGYYYFTHSASGDSSYHKPYGMKCAEQWSTVSLRCSSYTQPLYEHLVARLLQVGQSQRHSDYPSAHSDSYGIYNSSSTVTAECKTADSTYDDSLTVESSDAGVLSWQADKAMRHTLYARMAEQKYREGPYTRRSGPGKVTENHLTNCFLMPRKFHVVPPHTRPCASAASLSAELSSTVTALDGYRELSVAADAYYAVRNAFEGGPTVLLELMARHKNNVQVVALGLRHIAKCEPSDGADGRATVGTRAYVKKAVDMLRAWPTQTWIQVEALNALQNLTDKLSHRVVLRDDVHNWEDVVLLAMSRYETQLASVVVADETGRETRQELQVPTSATRDIAAYGSRVFGNMACDEDHRVHIATVAAEAVKTAIDTIQDDGAAAYFACIALYNFCYKSQEAHDLLM
eukprot:16175-Heterococcus_DN1.PRE.1